MIEQKTKMFFCLMIISSSLLALNNALKTEEECLGEFEFWSCQSPTRKCQRICENKGIDKKKLKCDGECQRACVCEAGYLRDGIDGECVYETECFNNNNNDDSTQIEQIESESTTTTTTTTARPKTKKVKNNSAGKKLADVKRNKPKRFTDTEFIDNEDRFGEFVGEEIIDNNGDDEEGEESF
ncbi:hypothetical protein DERP_011672 [Dermatophagoides pteronyssinus]|uniref:TIL domain-containing protein n=1 Tax=Dermatophagoides pteronyssinus TaxID=6956 RepID=A0ABQ8J309_DERPT|nr:hypothetical protein DERP_011672 [Dermatophagoides pteronyssinus]